MVEPLPVAKVFVSNPAVLGEVAVLSSMAFSVPEFIVIHTGHGVEGNVPDTSRIPVARRLIEVISVVLALVVWPIASYTNEAQGIEWVTLVPLTLIWVVLILVDEIPVTLTTPVLLTKLNSPEPARAPALLN